ncbi:MAG: hypothetical protein V4721_09765 [Bacteroidota bacterium]
MRYPLIFLLLLQFRVYGQNSGPVVGAMGSGGTAVSGIWGLHKNPAGISGADRAKLAIAYERHFLDAEVNTKTALFILPVQDNVLGLSFNTYGFDEYREQQAGLFFAKKFGDSFRLGAGLKYHQLSIFQYGSAKAYTVEIGFQLKLTSNVTIASNIVNPNRSRYNDLSNSSLPVKISIGTACRLSDRIYIIGDIEKILNQPLDAMTGIEYNIINWFSLRGGISANPFKQYAGFGLDYNKIQIDLAVASHPRLGYSPQISLGYEF